MIVHLAWDRRGAAEAARRGHAVVICDVLRFSTACAVAAEAGVEVVPVPTDDEARRIAAELPGARIGREHLSPARMRGLPRGSALVLATPNGATCCALAAGAPLVLAGAIVNASAVAAALAGREEVTVLACGERWPDDTLRVALEDELGAGAVIAALPPSVRRSPEARAAEATFRALQPDLEAVLLALPSGEELVAKGLGDDVRFAARLDAVDAAPTLREGRLR